MEVSEEFVFINQLETHEPNIDGGSNFQRLDELIGVPLEGTIDREPDFLTGEVKKYTQTIDHWAGQVRRDDGIPTRPDPINDIPVEEPPPEEKKINILDPDNPDNLTKGYEDFDYKGGQYVGQVDEDGLPSGEGKLTWTDGLSNDGPWFKGES